MCHSERHRRDVFRERAHEREQIPHPSVRNDTSQGDDILGVIGILPLRQAEGRDFRKELFCSVRQQDGNAVRDWIDSPTASALQEALIGRQGERLAALRYRTHENV